MSSLGKQNGAKKTANASDACTQRSHGARCICVAAATTATPQPMSVAPYPSRPLPTIHGMPMSSAPMNARNSANPTVIARRLRSSIGIALKITDVMTPIPQCCTPDDSIIEVARVMEQHDVGVVPIVESQD